MAGQPAAVTVRVPPIQPAVLLLGVCAVAALNLYGHPSPTVRLASLAAGAVCAVAAAFTSRMLLVADAQGVAVRRLAGTAYLPWNQVSRVELAPVRGAMTVRFVRGDGTALDVPPSLLQPTVPTRRPLAMARLVTVLRELEALRAG